MKSKPRKTRYHSMVSRRDFMKLLGVGTGVAALGGVATKGYSDFDGMMASEFSERRLPFWVKEVDQPTVEIDWDVYRQFPHAGATLFNPNVYGMDEYMAMMGKNIENARQNILSNSPTRTLKDHALHDANSWGWDTLPPPWTGPVMQSDPTMALRMTPQELDVPRYEGSPEENSRMIRTAARIFGAFDVGFVKLNQRTKKLLYGNILFQDVDEGFDPGDGTLVLPDKDLWVIVAGMPQSLMLGQANNLGGTYSLAYSMTTIYSNRILAFLRGIGYQGYGGSTATVGIAPGFGVMAGLAEYGRTGQMVSPIVGNMFRTVMLSITDLPLAETKPIDAGILNFCKTCKKCAENCPSGALNTADEPDWIDDVPPWQSTYGVKGYKVDTRKCFTQMFTNNPACGVCQSVCPFSKFDKAAIHDVIRATVGTTSAANSLIANLDDTFGYGLKSPEEGANIWDMDPWDVPIYGLDSSRS